FNAAKLFIPNPRVGSSNLSTPAIFKASVERLGLFCICRSELKRSFHTVIISLSIKCESAFSSSST
ncbi:hypothetical protein ACQ7JZ_004271, partial [Vibrio parahaemolyticus]